MSNNKDLDLLSLRAIYLENKLNEEGASPSKVDRVKAEMSAIKRVLNELIYLRQLFEHTETKITEDISLKSNEIINQENQYYLNSPKPSEVSRHNISTSGHTQELRIHLITHDNNPRIRLRVYALKEDLQKWVSRGKSVKLNKVDLTNLLELVQNV